MRGALAGWRVVVTRAADQMAELAELLRAAEAVPIGFSTIAIVDPADGGAALAAATSSGLDRYSWVVLTSQNAVDRLGVPVPAGVKVAAIGPSTAAALAAAGTAVDLVPARHVAEGLLEEFPPPGEAGARVLLPQAAGARPVLAAGLRDLGYVVEVVEAYRTVTARPSAADLDAVAGADAVLFTSSSTITNFVEVAGLERVPAVVACIGPVTASTAAGAGIEVDVVAAEHTVHGLVAALCEFASVPASASVRRARRKGPKTHPGTVAE